MGFFVFVWLIFLLANLNFSLARIYHIDELNVPGSAYYQRYGAYTVPDSPFGGTAPPSFRVNLILAPLSEPSHWNKTDVDMALGEIILFHFSRRAHFGTGGFSVLEGREYCCTQKLYDSEKCNELNSMIINSPLDRDDLYYQRLTWSNYQNTQRMATLEFSTTLEHTGVWYFFIANCESPVRHGVELGITGTLQWKNPYGYLSGQILGLLPLYWITSSIYIILGLVWGIFALKYRHDMVKLQHAITVVIFISIIESLIWASNYSVLNSNGLNSDATNVFAALFSSFKLTFVRTLMVVVAIGYTITRPKIERSYAIGLVLLSCLYFVIAGTNLYMDVAIAAGRFVDPGWKLFFFVLLIIANIVYFAWIAYELYATFRKLKDRDLEKLSLYKRLTILLAICLFVSVCIVISVLITDATENADEHFRSAWLLQGYWEFVYVACLLFVAWVWRPNSDNNRFAYGEFEDEDPENSPKPEGTSGNNVNLDQQNENEEEGEAIGPMSAESSDESSSSSSDFESSGNSNPTRGIPPGMGITGLGAASMFRKEKWLPSVPELAGEEDTSDDEEDDEENPQ